MKEFIDRVLGMPYDLHNRNGVSCWTLVAMYYDSKGVDLPSYPVASSLREVNRLFTQAFLDNEHGFNQTDTPSDGDVIIMKSKRTTHCGLYVGGKILHSSCLVCGVCIQRIDEVMRDNGFSEMEYWTK